MRQVRVLFTAADRAEQGWADSLASMFNYRLRGGLTECVAKRSVDEMHGLVRRLTCSFWQLACKLLNILLTYNQSHRLLCSLMSHFIVEIESAR
jgi:hypothetical protein